MGRRGFAWPPVVGLCLLASLSVAASGGDLLVDSGQRLGNEATWGVALGDVDGDGDLDAVTANFDVGAIVWLNDGTGRFSDSGQRLGTGLCESVALADLDGDGAIDIVLGGWDVPISVWWNEGCATFAQGEMPSVNRMCQCLAIGDLSGDGRPDIFVGTDGPDVVLLNAGNRIFLDSGQSLGARPTSGAALGDMDGDDDLDVVAAGWDEPGHVWQNDGTGRLSQLSSFDAVTLHIHGARLADVDRDGDLDAVFALAGRVCCRNVWLNDGAGNLTRAEFDIGNDLQQGIAVSDFDLDGDVDIAQAIGVGARSAPSRVWLADGGTFVDSGVRMGNAFAGSIAAGDLDGDGDEDLFIGFLSLLTGWDYLPHPNQVWINTTNE